MGNSTLPGFIRKNLEHITGEWQDFAETLAMPGVKERILRNSIHAILFYIADDIESPQTALEQTSKSLGHRDALKDSPGARHGTDRFNIGFDIIAMVSEYRALRATIIRLWTATRIVVTSSDISDLIRFNESIDQLLAQSVASFVQKNLVEIESTFQTESA